MSSSGKQLLPYYNLANIGGSDPFGTALAGCTANGGGTIYVPSKTFQVGSYTISVPIKVLGDNFGSSVLQQGAGVNADMFTLGVQQICFEHVGLDGNKANQTSGRIIAASLTQPANYFTLLRCWLKNSFSDSVFLQGPGSSLTGKILFCHIDQSGGHGINVSAGSAADCEMHGVVVSNSAGSGANVNAGDTVFNACHMWGNAAAGIIMPSGAGGNLRVTGGYYEQNGTYGIQPRGTGNVIDAPTCQQNHNCGIYAFSNTGLTVSGGVYRNNGQSGAAGITSAGITFDTCTASSVSGAVMRDDQGTKTQTYGYAENGNLCNACSISGNVTRAADHKTGAVLLGTGNPTATLNTGNVV